MEEKQAALKSHIFQTFVQSCYNAFVGKLKNRWSFYIALILSAVLLSTGLYFLKGYLPLYAKGFTDEIISVLALVIAVGNSLYGKFFPKRLVRKYHVSPIDLVSYYQEGPDIRIKVHLENSGEVDVNLQFQWIDFMNERYLLSRTMDSRGNLIDSSVELTARRQKDVYLAFESTNVINNVRKEYKLAFRILDFSEHACGFPVNAP